MSVGLNANQLTDVAPGWVSEPDGRGTWKLLYSCLITLFLCVYSAIHLNVGPPGETAFKWWIHKCKWVGVGIVSPELVLYCAGKQWFSARRLCRKLDEFTETYDPDPSMIQVEPFFSRADPPRRAVSLLNMTFSSYSD